MRELSDYLFLVAIEQTGDISCISSDFMKDVYSHFSISTPLSGGVGVVIKLHQYCSPVYLHGDGTGFHTYVDAGVVLRTSVLKFYCQTIECITHGKVNNSKQPTPLCRCGLSIKQKLERSFAGELIPQ